MSAQPKPIAPDEVEPLEFEAEIREGIADADAGRVTPWQGVRDWMTSWGTEKELPAPGQSSPVSRTR